MQYICMGLDEGLPELASPDESCFARCLVTLLSMSRLEAGMTPCLTLGRAKNTNERNGKPR